MSEFLLFSSSPTLRVTRFFCIMQSNFFIDAVVVTPGNVCYYWHIPEALAKSSFKKEVGITLNAVVSSTHLLLSI